MGSVVATYGALIAIGVGSTIIPAIFQGIAAGPGGPGPAVFGAAFGTLVWGITALAAGYFAFLAVGWVMRRVLALRSRIVAVAMSLLGGFTAVYWLLAPGSPANLMSSLPSAPIMWIMILNPYAALAAVMERGIAAAIMAGSRGGTAPGTIQLWIWAAASGILIALSVLLWTLAIRIFRARA